MERNDSVSRKEFLGLRSEMKRERRIFAGALLLVVSIVLVGTQDMIFRTKDASNTSTTRISVSNGANTATIKFSKSDLQLENSGTGQTAELRFLDTGSNYVGFKAPNSATTTVWTLPNADGSAGQVLTTDSAANLSWQSLSGVSVTSLNTATGAVTIAGGNGNSVSNAGSTITINGPQVSGGVGLLSSLAGTTWTIDLQNTSVSPGTYGSANQVGVFTVDAQGRITSAANVIVSGTIPGGGAGGDLSGTYPNPTVLRVNGTTFADTTAANANILVANGTSWFSKPLSGDATINNNGLLSLGATGVTAGSYMRANIAVDSKGRITSASNGAAVDLGTEVTGTLGIANGGTGASTAAAALSNLGAAAAIHTHAVDDLTQGTATTGQVLKFNGTAWASGADNDTTYTAGTGISIAGTTISNTGDANAADDLTTSTTFSGDVSGTASAISVTKIQGTGVSATPPTTGQVLKFNGTSWASGADNDTTYSAGTGISIVGTTISNSGDVNPADDVLTSSTFAGDVSGTFSALTVTKIQGVAVSTTAPFNTQVLAFNSTTSQWEPSGAGSGTVTSITAGAGLSGGTITTSGTISIAAGGVTNAMLTNSSVTVTAGAGLSGGGAVSLGGTTTLSVATGGINSGMILDGTISDADLSPTASIAVGKLATTAIDSGKFLRSYGTIWSAQLLVAADIPTHNHNAADINAGLLAVNRGGTGADLSTTGGPGKVLRQTTLGGPVTVAGLDASDIATGTIAVGKGGTGADLSTTGGPAQYLKQTTLGGSVTVGSLNAADIAVGTLGVTQGGTGANLGTTGGPGQVLKQTSLGSPVSVGSLAAADLPPHTHNAADINTGTLGVARGGTGADLLLTGGAGMVLKQSSLGGTVSVSVLAAADLPPDGVDSSKIVNGSILDIDISPTAGIGVGKLGTGAPDTGRFLRSDGLAWSAQPIAAGDLPPGGVDSSKIADGSIIDIDISPTAAVGVSKLGTGAPDSGKFLRSNGTNWSAALIAAGDLPPGGVDSSKITDGSIVDIDISPTAGIGLTKLGTGGATGNEFLKFNSVLFQWQPAFIAAADLPPSGVDSSKIADGSIADIDISPTAGIAVAKLGTAAPDSAKFLRSNGTSWSGQFIVAGDLPPSGVDSSKIADGSIVDIDISPTAGVGVSKLGTGAPDSGKFLRSNGTNWLAAFIAAGDLPPSGVDSSKIADGSIVDVDISPTAAVGVSKLGTGGPDTGKFLRSDGIAWSAQFVAISDLPAGGYAPDFVNVIGDTMTGSLTMNTGAAPDSILTEDGIQRNSPAPQTFALQNTDVINGLDLNLADGNLQTAGTTRLTNGGALQNIASIAGSGFLDVSAGAASVLTLSVGAVERMRIDSTGNVGIGTTAPTFPLDIRQNSTFVGAFVSAFDATGGQSGIVLRGARGTQAVPSASAVGDIIGALSFRGYGATGFAATGRAAIQGSAAEAWSDTAQGAFLSFLTTAAGGTLTNEKVRITAAGDLGIGANAIPTPASRLHVDDAIGSPFRVTAGAGVTRLLVNAVGEVGIGGAPAAGIQLDVAGLMKSQGQVVSVTTTAATYACASTDDVVIVVSGIPSITLLGSAAPNGRILRIRHAGGAGTVTVNPGAGTTLNGGGAITQGTSQTYVLSGGVWYAVGN